MIRRKLFGDFFQKKLENSLYLTFIYQNASRTAIKKLSNGRKMQSEVYYDRNRKPENRRTVIHRELLGMKSGHTGRHRADI